MARKSWMNVVMKAALISGCIAVYVFVETGTRDHLSRMEHKIDRVETKLTARIDQMESKLTARIDRVEAKLSARIDRVEAKLSARIDGVESTLSARIDRIETKLDRVETKIDEVIGYLKYRSDTGPSDSSPSGMKE